MPCKPFDRLYAAVVRLTFPAGVVAPPEVDTWDLLEPVDVLWKLPATFTEGVESKKWQERRDALQMLLTLCTDNPRLCPKASYGEHVNILKRVNPFGLIQMLK